MKFPKTRDIFWGPYKKGIVYWSLSGGPPILENYHIGITFLYSLLTASKFPKS